MALDISTQERTTTHYVGIPVRARFSEFGAPHGPNVMIPRVYAWLSEQNVAPLGGPLYIYRHLGQSRDEAVELTVAVPVAEPVTPMDMFVFGSLPAGTYVVGEHAGSPDSIADSCVEVGEWARARGIRLAMTQPENGEWIGFAEHYLTDPAVEPDPTRWVTQLLFKTV